MGTSKQFETVKISVIIPVWNVEEYIGKFMDSLLNQTFRDLEFLFVDDCGTDRSMQLVEERAAKDPRIRILRNEKNLGAGPSRNRGIEAARGEYLSFVDPDDYLALDFYELLYQRAMETGKDIIKGTVKLEGGENKPRQAFFAGLNAQIVQTVQSGQPLYTGFRAGHLSGIYRTGVVREHHVTYGSTRVGEDNTFMLRLCLATSDIAFCDEAIYHYVHRAHSLTNAEHFGKHRERLRALRERVGILKEQGLDQHGYEFLRRQVEWHLKGYADACSAAAENPEEIAEYLAEFDSILREVDNPSMDFSRQPSYVFLKEKLSKGRPPCKVSVVVPMYNCEAFLDTFFDDLSAQELDSFEVICVDDGSTDDTLKGILKQCAKDSRFRCFSKERGGAGTARNEGLRLACGKYVQFLDADDRFSPRLLSVLYHVAEEKQADIVICQVEHQDYRLKTTRTDMGFKREALPDREVVTPSQFPNLYQIIGGAIWNKLYRREFILEHDLRFSSTRVANDSFFLCASASVAKRIVGVDEYLLTIRRHINPNSISSKRAEHTEDTITVRQELYDWLEKKGLEETFRNTHCMGCVFNIEYNAGYAYNHAFVRAAVEMLCTREPWILPEREEFWKWCRKRMSISQKAKELRRLQDALDRGEAVEGADPQERIRLLANQILAFRTMNRMAQEEYGRILFEDEEKEKIPLLEQKAVQLQKERADLQGLLDRNNKELAGKEEELASKEKELECKDKELERRKQEVERIRRSWNYRVGAVVTALPKKLWYGIKRLWDGVRKG